MMIECELVQLNFVIQVYGPARQLRPAARPYQLPNYCTQLPDYPNGATIAPGCPTIPTTQLLHPAA